MNAVAEALQPDTLEIAENPATSLQRAGNGILVNGLVASADARRKANGFGGQAAASRQPARQRKRQAEAFANSCHDLLPILREQMGLDQPKHTQTSPETQSQPNGNGGNGEKTCEPVSKESARAGLKEAAGILVNLIRGWDTALERLRVERGVPDPGCRRPGEPIPKARKPANRAPDSLACGSDTPTGSVPAK